mmetsp:Transcript_19013/g.61230  ORF Transcript_19013/g.61230 Transcript_19013/m.61230 type:complete len:284 (-) Transcript_19013:200-1051(-)
MEPPSCSEAPPEEEEEEEEGDFGDLSEEASRRRESSLFDAVVSELLGSFGDNELAPECLDVVAARWLRPGGVSIPGRYASYAQPVAAAGLWRDARRASSVGAPPGPPPALFCPGAPPAARGLETPFVVKLHAYAPLARPLPCFAFCHRRTIPVEKTKRDRRPAVEVKTKEKQRDNHVRLAFPPRGDATLDVVAHGLAGYFDAELYDDVAISIHPDTKSPGMFSWFPLFLPFAAPVHLRANDRLVVDLWRRSDTTRVWYEWAVVEPTLLPIQNPNGRSFAMHLN